MLQDTGCVSILFRLMLLPLVYVPTGPYTSHPCTSRVRGEEMADTLWRPEGRPNLAHMRHEPVATSSDTDFETQGWLGNWTQDNLYVIERVNVTTSDICILIDDTTAHFVIRGRYVQGPVNMEILLRAVQNGTV